MPRTFRVTLARALVQGDNAVNCRHVPTLARHLGMPYNRRSRGAGSHRSAHSERHAEVTRMMQVRGMLCGSGLPQSVVRAPNQ